MGKWRLAALFASLKSRFPCNRRGRGVARNGQRRHALPRLLVLEDRTLPSTPTVLTNADSGDGSLRAAIVAARRRRPKNNCPCGCVGPA
jgi:hypothetical protein